MSYTILPCEAGLVIRVRPAGKFTAAFDDVFRQRYTDHQNASPGHLGRIPLQSGMRERYAANASTIC
jgi:hypothetical protein